MGYSGQEILRDIHFTVPKGKITGLIGPNGCGKTTLLKTAGGLLPPLAGRVEIAGKPAKGYRPKELARLAALLPQVRETPGITAERLVAHGRYPHLSFGRQLTQNDRRLVAEAMEEAGCAAFRGRDLRELSGGERQRVYIAMALAQDAQALLLDEPTTYLDIGQQLEVMALLRQLSEKGKTVLAVLHDLDLAFGLCDYVGLVAQGQLQSFGPPARVFEEGRAGQAFGVRGTRVEAGGRGHYIFY